MSDFFFVFDCIALFFIFQFAIDTKSQISQNTKSNLTSNKTLSTLTRANSSVSTKKSFISTETNEYNASPSDVKILSHASSDASFYDASSEVKKNFLFPFFFIFFPVNGFCSFQQRIYISLTHLYFLLTATVTDG